MAEVNSLSVFAASVIRTREKGKQENYCFTKTQFSDWIQRDWEGEGNREAASGSLRLHVKERRQRNDRDV